MDTNGRSPASDRLTRRTFLVGAAATSFLLSACRQRPARGLGARRARAESFTVRHGTDDVRCLWCDQLVAEDGPGCLLIVLLHGSRADASQWTDIGLVEAVDGLDLRRNAAVDRVVAVAPDLADPTRGPDFVVRSLLPHLDHRFAPGMLAVSGISSGAATALGVARAHSTPMGSVGLHSPAIRLDAPIESAPWSCFLDVGDEDPLAISAAHTAEQLRSSGITVHEHHWSGGHNRSYWRSHLPDYLMFHLDEARRSVR